MRVADRGTLRLLVAVVAVAAIAAGGAWLVGRQHHDPVAAIAYTAGPTDDREVSLSTVADDHPDSTAVRELFQGYFDAINQRDYSAWRSSVTDDQAHAQDPDRWRAGYATTIDSNVLVMSIQDDPLRARVRFSSEQSVDLAPSALRTGCINWDLTYLVVQRDGRLLISGLDPTAQSMVACS